MRKLVLYASQIGIWNTHTYTQIYTVICTEIYTQIYAQISVLNVAFAAAAHHCSSVAVAVISHVAKIYGFHLLVACGSQCQQQQQQPATTTRTTVTTTKLNSALAAASAAPAMIDH